MRRAIFILLCLAYITVLNAQNFVIDQIGYFVIEPNEVEVAYADETISGNVTIPSSVTYQDEEYKVTSIGRRAFYNCTKLTSVDIPNSVTEIEDNAFRNCTRLVSVTIPNSVTEIGSYAFKDCQSLTSATIPNSVTSIGDYAFAQCYSLASATLPEDLTSIGVATFCDCTHLASIIIPNSVTSIEDVAFANCTSLTSLDIPNSVTSIGSNTFYNCANLASVNIPNSVTSIGDEAFTWCIKLASVTIGESVNDLNNAFVLCTSVKEIYCMPSTPPANPSFEDKVYSQATLYVPVESKGVYASTKPWKKFKKIVEYDFSGVDDVSDDFDVNVKVENGQLIVYGIDENEPIAIYNMTGSLIYSGTEHSISSLAPGMYIVKAGKFSAKFVI